MVFANHRSQADFFLDNVLLDYKTNFLSRYLLASIQTCSRDFDSVLLLRLQIALVL